MWPRFRELHAIFPSQKKIGKVLSPSVRQLTRELPSSLLAWLTGQSSLCAPQPCIQCDANNDDPTHSDCYRLCRNRRARPVL